MAANEGFHLDRLDQWTDEQAAAFPELLGIEIAVEQTHQAT